MTPFRQINHILFVIQFQFRDHEASILVQEFVDFPDAARMMNFMAKRVIYQRINWKNIFPKTAD